MDYKAKHLPGMDVSVVSGNVSVTRGCSPSSSLAECGTHPRDKKERWRRGSDHIQEVVLVSNFGA
jgi:hypothetical protein